MKPSTVERNLTPTSTALVSVSWREGRVELLQMLHGQLAGAAVVNDQVKLAASGAFEESRSSKVLVLTVEASIASLKVAVMFAPVPTPEAPLDGDVEVT